MFFPVVVFAQAPIRSGSGFGILSILLALIIIVCIFLLCREIVCWYWKINKTISNQEEIIRLLRKIANEKNETDNNQQRVIPLQNQGLKDELGNGGE